MAAALGIGIVLLSQGRAFELEDGKYKYTGSDGKSAEKKIRAFYNWSIGILLVIALSLVFVTSGWW